MAKQKPDFLAVINVGGAGSYYRGPDKEKAIKEVVRIFKRDFKSYFKLERGKPINIDVLDVTGHDTIRWDCTGYWNEDKNKHFKGPVERIVRTL